MGRNRNKKVSVIMPTYNRYEVALKNVENLQTQSYSDFEIIICDDSEKDYFQKRSWAFREELKKIQNAKYCYVARFDVDGKKDYGLARARNFGIINSEGDTLVFLDDRITADTNELISIFAANVKAAGESKIWFFGDKGAQKQSFVENCSAVKRDYLIDAGMFCERIDKYGGMTREIERRLSHQGFAFQYIPEAKAKQLHKSTGWDKKPKDIEEMRAQLKRMFDQ